LNVTATDSNHYVDSEATRLLQQILEGVLYLHSHGIVDRDIKPDNILVTKTKQIKILDFNVAAFHENHCSYNYLSWNNYAMSQVTGTPAFNSPEMTSTAFYTESIDSWSIGLTFHFMLFGELPKEQEYRFRS